MLVSLVSASISEPGMDILRYIFDSFTAQPERRIARYPLTREGRCPFEPREFQTRRYRDQ